MRATVLQESSEQDEDNGSGLDRASDALSVGVLQVRAFCGAPSLLLELSSCMQTRPKCTKVCTYMRMPQDALFPVCKVLVLPDTMLQARDSAPHDGGAARVSGPPRARPLTIPAGVPEGGLRVPPGS